MVNSSGLGDLTKAIEGLREQIADTAENALFNPKLAARVRRFPDSSFEVRGVKQDFWAQASSMESSFWYYTIIPYTLEYLTEIEMEHLRAEATRVLEGFETFVDICYRGGLYVKGD